MMVAGTNYVQSAEDEQEWLSAYSALMKGWIISGVFAWLAIVLSTILIYRHLKNFTKPEYQRHIVRILLMVPVYSLCAWLNYRYVSIGLWLDFIRSCFEAFVIYEFFVLLLAYLGADEQEQRRLLSNKSEMKHLPPFQCYYYDPSRPYFLMDIKLMVLQYVVIQPLTVVISIFLEAYGLYRAESMSPMYGNFWIVTINFISTSLAMYALIIFFLTIRDNIREYKPITKFLSVKFIVFMTFWQSLIIGACDFFGLIPNSIYYPSANISVGVQSLLLCVEMFLASIWHHSNLCFGVGDFKMDSRSGEGTDAYDSLKQCFDPTDTMKEIVKGSKHILRRFWIYMRRPHTELPQDDVIDLSIAVDLEERNLMSAQNKEVMSLTSNPVHQRNYD
ncbi:hypothetical protein MIR68_004363 [Amoeboaphelidium protococcarum]|nr:hypothetical protein MIR68_004363 [Amoeboaphelidium protococcarum]